MGRVRYVDFHPDEWIAGTVSLSLAERGLYITACALIYSHGGPIEVEHLRCTCRQGRAHGRTFNAALNRLLNLGKLILDGTLLSNNRARNELEKSAKRARNARENGARNNKNKDLQNPAGVTINHQSSFPKEKELFDGAIAPTSASPPPMGDALGLMDRGERLIGNRLVVYQQLSAVGLDKVARALDAVERRECKNPVAYFLACCRGPAVVKELPNLEEIARHAAEEREAARLRVLREYGLRVND